MNQDGLTDKARRFPIGADEWIEVGPIRNRHESPAVRIYEGGSRAEWMSPERAAPWVYLFTQLEILERAAVVLGMAERTADNFARAALAFRDGVNRIANFVPWMRKP